MFLSTAFKTEFHSFHSSVPVFREIIFMCFLNFAASQEWGTRAPKSLSPATLPCSMFSIRNSITQLLNPAAPGKQSQQPDPNIRAGLYLLPSKAKWNAQPSASLCTLRYGMGALGNMEYHGSPTQKYHRNSDLGAKPLVCSMGTFPGEPLTPTLSRALPTLDIY